MSDEQRIPIPPRKMDPPWKPPLSVDSRGFVICDEHDAEYALCLLEHRDRGKDTGDE